MTNRTRTLERRAGIHSALGEPTRLAIVDLLTWSDLTPSQVTERLGIPSNLVAHHVDVLVRVGVVERRRSSGDRRRRYLRLRRRVLADLMATSARRPRTALFVCTQNSARSQLAAALWRVRTGSRAWSAGTHPARRVHPGAVVAGRRAGLDLSAAVPRRLDRVRVRPDVVVTVCDLAREELGPAPDWLHWSIPDPVRAGTARAFEAALRELDARIGTLAGAPAGRRGSG